LRNIPDWEKAHRELVKIDEYIRIGEYDVIKGIMKDKKIKFSPVHLGVLVYGYSRKHMYDNIFSKVNREKIHQTDTDSAMISESELETFRKSYP
jgi:hypothetical protein